MQMENTFLITISAGITACIVTTIGIHVINRFSKWGKKNTIYFIAFASGVLISVSFMHIIPESFKMNVYSPVFLLVGFLSLHILNRLINVFLCDKKDTRGYSFGIIPAIGIGFHSLIDGVIYSVAFSVSIFTGVLAAFGMILHEFPEGIVIFLFLVKSGFSKKKSILYAFLVAGLTTPVGALISYPYISKLTPSVLGIFLALSAGTLVYVGATHLLPEVEKKHKKYSFLSLVAGIIVAVIIILSKG
jgi:zinc and cadmium transporter